MLARKQCSGTGKASFREDLNSESSYTQIALCIISGLAITVQNSVGHVNQRIRAISKR